MLLTDDEITHFMEWASQTYELWVNEQDTLLTNPSEKSLLAELFWDHVDIKLQDFESSLKRIVCKHNRNLELPNGLLEFHADIRLIEKFKLKGVPVFRMVSPNPDYIPPNKRSFGDE